PARVAGACGWRRSTACLARPSGPRASPSSPATYALEGIRAAVLDGAGVGAIWGDLWPLLVLGAVAIPAGLVVFRAGERYAKLKRSGRSVVDGATAMARAGLVLGGLPGQPQAV